MQAIIRFFKYFSAITYDGLNFLALLRFFSVLQAQPVLDGAASEEPSIFVYAIY